MYVWNELIVLTGFKLVLEQQGDDGGLKWGLCSMI